MSYYFTNDPNLKENRKKIDFRFLNVLETFISDDGVFSKGTLDFGSRTLIETLIEETIEGEVLDMGCGIGVMGILLKKYKPSINVTMVDVNERAVNLAQANSQLYKQDNDVLISNGFENVEKEFDVIMSNPPIRTGKKVIYAIFADAFKHLKDNGKLYLVIRDKQGANSAVNYLKTLFNNIEVIRKHKGYWIILCKKSG